MHQIGEDLPARQTDRQTAEQCKAEHSRQPDRDRWTELGPAEDGRKIDSIGTRQDFNQLDKDQTNCSVIVSGPFVSLRLWMLWMGQLQSTANEGLEKGKNLLSKSKFLVYTRTLISGSHFRNDFVIREAQKKDITCVPLN